MAQEIIEGLYKMRAKRKALRDQLMIVTHTHIVYTPDYILY